MILIFFKPNGEERQGKQMNNQDKSTVIYDGGIAPELNKLPEAAPIGAVGEITVGNLFLNIKREFLTAGETTFTDKLFIIANRKLKGVIEWRIIAQLLFWVAALIIFLALLAVALQTHI